MNQIIIDKSKMNPKFFFLTLGVLVTLIASVTSFINLIFEVLNKKFPDVLNASYQYGYNTYQFDAMRSALATLIIVFPAFLILSYFWKKAMKGGLGRVDELLRKWMLYIVVFLAGVILVIDLVTLVKYFVSGEITTRFILKVIAVLLVALFVGLNYIWELQGRERIFGFKIGLWGTIKSSMFVLALVVWSFCVMGSPAEQRQFRLDDRRVQDLQSIQWQVISYWQQKEKLPENLDAMKDPISSWMAPVDPEFEKGMTYEYKKLGDLKFELCATFSLPMPEGWNEYSGGGIYPMYKEGRDMAVSYPYPGGGVNESWKHDVGRTCFERTIDPEIYKPFKSL